MFRPSRIYKIGADAAQRGGSCTDQREARESRTAGAEIAAIVLARGGASGGLNAAEPSSMLRDVMEFAPAAPAMP